MPPYATMVRSGSVLRRTSVGNSAAPGSASDGRQDLVVAAVLRRTVEQLVLEEHDRKAPFDRRSLEQTADVVTMARKDDRETRHGRHQMLGALTVCRSVAASASARRADDQRHRHVLEHTGELHRMVVQLVHRQRQEVGEHDLGDRPITGQRKADGRADDARFADRSRDHAAGKIRRQPGRHLERAAVRDREDPRRAG